MFIVINSWKKGGVLGQRVYVGLVWEMSMVPWLSSAWIFGLPWFGIILSLEMGRDLVFWLELIFFVLWVLKGKIPYFFKSLPFSLMNDFLIEKVTENGDSVREV